MTRNAFACSLALIVFFSTAAPFTSMAELDGMFDYEMIHGTVLGLFVDPDAVEVIVLVEAYGDGSLTISLPRNTIDSQNDSGIIDFIVLVDGEESGFYETDTTATARTLLIPLPEGSKLIEIIGTRAAAIQPIAPVNLDERNPATLAMIFISNSADGDGCPESDWKFAYEMGSLAWTYLAEYNITTTLHVMCQSINDYDAYHPSALVTMHILGKGQNLPDPGILYDRDEMSVSVQGEEIPVYGVAMFDEAKGERFYVRPYTVYGNQYYDLSHQQTAWAVSHELSHIALHILGHTEDVYTDWVHREQQRCNASDCQVERITVKNYAWPDTTDAYYDVIRHYN